MTLKDLRELADLLLDKDEELLRSKQEWESTFNSVPDLIVILDNNSTITRVNKSTIDKLGIRKDQIVGKRCYELFHNSTESPDDCPHKEMLETGEIQKRVKFIKDLNGWYEITLTPLLDSIGEIIGAVHILHDITDIKRKESELLESNISLAAMNQELRAISDELTHRLSTMDDFVKEFKDVYEAKYRVGE